MNPLLVKLGMLVFDVILYPLIRRKLREAIDKPDKRWDGEMMDGADEVFNKTTKGGKGDGSNDRTLQSAGHTDGGPGNSVQGDTDHTG